MIFFRLKARNRYIALIEGVLDTEHAVINGFLHDLADELGANQRLNASALKQLIFETGPLLINDIPGAGGHNNQQNQTDKNGNFNTDFFEHAFPPEGQNVTAILFLPVTNT